MNYSPDGFTPAISWSTVDKVFSLRERDIDTDEPMLVPLEPPVKFLLDIASVKHGPLTYKPRFLKYTVPINEKPPALPPDVDEEGRPSFKMAVEVQVYAPTFGGLRMWTASGVFITRMLYNFISAAEETDSAQAGLIPVVQWDGAKPRKVTQGKGAGRIYGVPSLPIIGWMQRPAELGDRLIPVPVPLPALPVPAAMLQIGPGMAVRVPGGGPKSERLVDDEIPFGSEVR